MDKLPGGGDSFDSSPMKNSEKSGVGKAGLVVQ
jgi:hypothetical protein